MDKISYKLPDFEGPLDLLLFLVQKNKLNIYDIPIAEILEQYMETIRQMEALDMEIATEFLNMAARLVQIKSYMLLPKYEEETEELKRELTGELIEYQLCREMAAKLGPQHVGYDIFVRRAEEIEPDRTYRRVHPPQVLVDAYLAAVGRKQQRIPPSPTVLSGIISRKIVSVSSRIVTVLRKLRFRKTVSYDDMFAEAESKSDLVAIFLAMLELVKAKRIHVFGEPGKQTVKMEDSLEEDSAEEFVSDFDTAGPEETSEEET